MPFTVKPQPVSVSCSSFTSIYVSSLLQSNQTSSYSPEYALGFLPYLWASISSPLCYSEMLSGLQDAVSSVVSQPDTVSSLSPHTILSVQLYGIYILLCFINKDLCICLFQTDLKVPENQIISYNFVFPTAPTKMLAYTCQQGALSRIRQAVKSSSSFPNRL